MVRCAIVPPNRFGWSGCLVLILSKCVEEGLVLWCDGTGDGEPRK